MTKLKTLQIRNSTTEFLIFSKQAGENSIEVVQDRLFESDFDKQIKRLLEDSRS